MSISTGGFDLLPKPSKVEDALTRSSANLPVSVGSASPGALAENWSEPKPVKAKLPAVEPFHFDLVPETFRTWLVDIAERMQCSAAFLGAALMVMLGAVVGRRVALRPKRYDDWTVVANLWGAVVGRPGVLKTPAVQEILAPLQRLEIEARAEFEKATKALLAQQFVEERRRKQKHKAVDKALKTGEGDPLEIAMLAIGDPLNAAKRVRYIANDATVEKLGELLQDNPNGLLTFRDELLGFFKSLEKDGHECDRAFYLEAWNGSGRFTYDRIGRGTVEIEAATVSIFGCIQPGPLAGYLQGAIDGGVSDDGFIQRLQVVVWPDSATTWTNVDRWPDTNAKNRAFEVVAELSKLDPAQFPPEPAGRFGSTIPVLRFDAPAQELFDAWRAGLEARLISCTEQPAFEAHLSKYRSLTPSLALLVYLANGGRTAVDAASFQSALEWEAFLESHARRIYAMGENAETTAALVILAHLKKGDLADGFNARDVYRKQWSGTKTVERTELGLALLVEHGWLRQFNTLSSSKPSYHIHPQLKFAQVEGLGTDNTDKATTDATLGADEGEL